MKHCFSCLIYYVILKLLYVQGERGAVGYPGASGRSGMKVLTGNNVQLITGF